jgi:hypothetical protein
MTELQTGDRVSWVIRSNGKACGVSSIHRVYENGKTFCKHVIPPEEQHLPPLKSLNICGRCENMNRRASAFRLKESA